MPSLYVNGDEVTECSIRNAMRIYELPAYMEDAVIYYLLHHISPGSFLRAVLENDLREAVAQADQMNSARLKEWVQFFYNECPSACWGSPGDVQWWLAQRKIETEE